MDRDALITSLLALEGYNNLWCVDDQITDGTWYYHVSMAGRCDDHDSGYFWGDKWGDISYSIYRYTVPVATNVYKMLAVLSMDSQLLYLITKQIHPDSNGRNML